MVFSNYIVGASEDPVTKTCMNAMAVKILALGSVLAVLSSNGYFNKNIRLRESDGDRDGETGEFVSDNGGGLVEDCFAVRLEMVSFGLRTKFLIVSRFH
uniref:Uncharacterized protein At2g45780 n=2 Tax=Arabidopsis thaliana TaxID=3702 RepID=O80841_ARATH|nr:hypothetical protein [Arabidopsis thaliana]